VSAASPPSEDHPTATNAPLVAIERWFSRYGFSLGFIALAGLPLWLWQGDEKLGMLGLGFVSIVLEAIPFLVIGALVSGVIEVYVPQSWIADRLPARRWYTVFLAAGLGFVFPVCECAIVIVVRRLIKKGVPLEAAVAFLLAGPIVNPLVALSTAYAYKFDWWIVLTRLVYGYGIAVTVGLIVGILFKPQQALVDLGDDEDNGCGHDHHHHDHDHSHEDAMKRSGWSRFLSALEHASVDFFEIARFLIMGAFFAGLVQVIVPQSWFVGTDGGWMVSVFAMMLLAVVLNLCSEADAFVAASFSGIGVPMSGQMAFLVLGPMLDVKLLLMYRRLFRPPAIATIASLTFLLTFLCMAAMEVMGG
jgi:uncharacterized membrane protein YraQ (UPF0718 family)